MLPHLRRRGRVVGRWARMTLVAPVLAFPLAFSACDKMPLLAPTGTVITLFTNSKVMPVNGTVEITATLIEQGAAAAPAAQPGQQQAATAGAGTPVHNGTLVTFTTTIGSIDPREARTHNGQVNVRLTGDGRSGGAKVTAFSGGAKSAELEILIGSAAAERVVLTANPTTVPSSGGTVQLLARVEDTAGNGLPGVPVTFSATAGTIVVPTVLTDDTGVARTSLTTNQNAKVTASAGAKTATLDLTLAPKTGISITPPLTAPTAGIPASFTVSVSITANIRDVTVSWGDGTSTSLGAISGSTGVSHVFANSGTYTVTATATDVTGDRQSVSTSVTVQPVVINVELTATATAFTSGTPITLTATVTPTTIQVASFQWDFGDGTTATTTGRITQKIYTVAAATVFTVRVTVTDVNGRTGFGQTQIRIIP